MWRISIEGAPPLEVAVSAAVIDAQREKTRVGRDPLGPITLDAALTFARADVHPRAERLIAETWRALAAPSLDAYLATLDPERARIEGAWGRELLGLPAQPGDDEVR